MKTCVQSRRLLTCLLIAWAWGPNGRSVAQSPIRASAARDNIVVVLDASGSMKGKIGTTTKMQAAKAALRKVMENVPETTNVGLLVFGAANLRNDWAYPLGPLETTRWEQAVGRPQATGATPLGAYLKKAADRLLEQREEQHGYGTFRLLVVTDGEANDRNLVDRYLPDILSRGITVDVIGVGMKSDHALATRVHSYRRADDPASLERAVVEVFRAEIDTSLDDAATAEAYELAAAIPNEMAGAIVAALTALGAANQAIGEQPVPAPRSATVGTTSPPPPLAAITPPVPIVLTPSDDGGGTGAWVAVAIVVLGVGAWFVFRGTQRGVRT